MGKPPASGPHSDISGVNRDARIGTPNRNAKQGSAEAVEEGGEEKKGNPPGSGPNSNG